MIEIQEILSVLKDFTSEHADQVSAARLVVSIAQWLQTASAARLKDASSSEKATVQEYLEWLRRQEHQQLAEKIQESQRTLDAISVLLSSLSKTSSDAKNDFMEQLRISNEVTQHSLEIIATDLATIRTRLTTKQHQYDKFESKYLAHVTKKYGQLRIIGVKELRDIKQSLSIAYVSLDLVSTAPDIGRPETISTEELLRRTDLLAVRGPAGSGKTTLLNWVAIQCSQGTHSPWSGLVPFFVPLRRIPGGEPKLASLVQYTVNENLFTATAPSNWLNRVIDDGRAVLLIDGVDELPAQSRPHFWDWLEKIIYTRPGNRVIVTSRHFSTDRAIEEAWNPPRQFVSAELREMTDANVQSFVRNWHDSITFHENDPEVVSELEHARDLLPEKLLDPINDRVRQLCRTPLLCALVCALHWRDEGYLPSQRVELYDRCCLLLLDERDRRRDIPQPSDSVRYLKLHDKEMILQRLAWSMMRNTSLSTGSQIEVKRRDALRWIQPNIKACDDDRARSTTPKQLIDYFVERAGLLREPTHRYIDFSHRSFQEYMAACAAGALNDVRDLAQRATDDVWNETLVIAAGTKVGGVPFGNSLIQMLLELGEQQSDRSLRHLYFTRAFACLETAKQVDRKTRRQVIKHVDELIPPKDSYEAKILSAAGEAIIPALEYDKWRHKPLDVLIPCAQALAGIGSAKARAMLEGANGYGSDTRWKLIETICRFPGINPFRVNKLARLLSLELLPAQFRAFFAATDDLSPLRECKRLHWRFFSENTGITDINLVLRHLKECESLRFDGVDNIKELTSLSALQSLKVLRFSDCGEITDLSPISGLTRLEQLSFDGCRISDLTPLEGLINLTEIHASGCPIEEIEAISGLTNLRLIDLTGCPISDFTPLQNLSQLDAISIDDRQMELMPKSLARKLRLQS